MSVLFLKRPGVIQPRWSAEIDYRNPLTRRLVRCISFAGPPRDLVTGEFLTRVGSGLSTEVTSRGSGSKNTDVNSYWTVPIKSETFGRMSALWVGRMASGGTGAQTVLRDSSTVEGTILFWRNAGWDMRLGGNVSSSNYTAAGTFDLEKVYFVVHTSGLAARIFVDGSQVMDAVASTGTGTLLSPWCVHHNGAFAGEGPLATSMLLCIWDIELDKSASLSLSQNPWQLFSSRQALWSSASGGGQSNAPRHFHRTQSGQA